MKQLGRRGSNLGSRRNILRGLLRIARFSAAGFDDFGDTREHLLAAIAPLAGFAIAIAIVVAARGHAIIGADNLFTMVCALLAPLVLSHPFAVAWQREPLWLRYATVFTWGQWLFATVGSLLLLAANLLVIAGVSARLSGTLFLACAGAYGFALQVFLARAGLSLSWARTVLLVVLVNIGAAILVIGPSAIALLAGR